MEVTDRVGSKAACSNNLIAAVTEVVFNILCCTPALKERPRYETLIKQVRLDFAQHMSDIGFGSLESEELWSCVFLARSLAHLKRVQKILKSVSCEMTVNIMLALMIVTAGSLGVENTISIKTTSVITTRAERILHQQISLENPIYGCLGGSVG